MGRKHAKTKLFMFCLFSLVVQWLLFTWFGGLAAASTLGGDVAEDKYIFVTKLGYVPGYVPCLFRVNGIRACTGFAPRIL